MSTSENAPTSGRELDPDEVADAEAQAIEGESSAGDGQPPTDLRADTTTEPEAADADSDTPGAGAPPSKQPSDEDRKVSQGSGQSSPSMADQQTAEPPTSS